jgi:aspartyl-tRNA(Asn)/glutamyl-tRNA(Gln) amidotransferase subunit A
MALSWTMDKIGPMAHTVEDCWTVFQAIAGFDHSDPSSSDRTLPPVKLRSDDDEADFKFGVLRGATDGVQSEVAANFDASLTVLGTMGTIEEVEFPDLPWDAAAGTMITAEASSAFEEFITSGELTGLTAPEDQIGLYHGLTLPAVDYLRALRIRRLGSRKLGELLAGYDAILAPSMPIVAPPIDQTFANWISRRRGQSLGGPGNLCGLPSIAVPNGFGENGLPTSLEFLGAAYGEDRIAEAARAYQTRTDWHRRHPDW